MGGEESCIELGVGDEGGNRGGVVGLGVFVPAGEICGNRDVVDVVKAGWWIRGIR